MIKNHDAHVFLEDIIYYPSQIEYYFEDQDGEVWCAYIRQRSGDLTFELVKTGEDDEGWRKSENWNKVVLSREYDINNQPNKEAERKEIDDVEEEVMCFLRQKFPEVEFPEHPEKRGRGWR